MKKLLNAYIYLLPFLIAFNYLGEFRVHAIPINSQIPTELIKSTGIFLPLFLGSLFGNILALESWLTHRKPVHISSWICIMVSLSWLWGFSVSIFKMTDLNYILSNFNFLSLFGIYNFMVFGLKPTENVKFIKIILKLNAYCFSAFVIGAISILMLLTDLDFALIISDLYTPMFYVAIPSFVVMLISPNTISWSKSFRITFSLCFILAYIGYISSVTYSIIMILLILYMLPHFFTRRSRPLLLALVTVILLVASCFSLVYVDVSSFAFLENDPRLEQIGLITKEFNLLGHGLGAGFADVEPRGGLPYSIELIYLNLVHKLGIFVVPLFAFYINTLYKLFTELKSIYIAKSRSDLNVPLAASFMLPFIIAGLFNPSGSTQMAPVYICTGLYILNTKAFAN
ncbi:putative membrane protein [Synechococcus sp. BIOS-U3-1]|uniref:hypothetical protein n=1 Tax=Synechococcus sp. BIOS-U3-1 TaxID=1400865 RepID=UPI00164530F3|nr:hypothetical protein [Synechococcus sp. BIOS-U3-1]QNI57165.1 putative membrane protein [Synechococcus sp. BIOS-U3-1]